MVIRDNQVLTTNKTSPGRNNMVRLRSVSMILRHLPGEFSEQLITLAPWGGLEG